MRVAKDYCLSDPCKNGAKCNETVTCACPHDSACGKPSRFQVCSKKHILDSMACKYFQCKTRPSFQCLCTSKYEGQYCKTKSKTSAKFVCKCSCLIKKCLEPPLTGSEKAWIAGGVVLGALLIAFVIFCVLWECSKCPIWCYCRVATLQITTAH